MTKKVFLIITGLFLFCALLALVGLNSFFQENLHLLQDNNKLDHLNKILLKENILLRRRMPTVPKGAIIDGMHISADPATAETANPKYILTLWVKNPTSHEIPPVRGIVYLQGLNAGGHLDVIAIQTPSVAAGERQIFTGDPMALGEPGTTVELIASLWGQPGVAKVVYTIPQVKVQEAPSTTENNKQPTDKTTDKPTDKTTDKPSNDQTNTNQ